MGSRVSVPILSVRAAMVKLCCDSDSSHGGNFGVAAMAPRSERCGCLGLDCFQMALDSAPRTPWGIELHPRLPRHLIIMTDHKFSILLCLFSG
jgi:hypothetical protein